jgi:hypothetical protein
LVSEYVENGSLEKAVTVERGSPASRTAEGGSATRAEEGDEEGRGRFRF